MRNLIIANPGLDVPTRSKFLQDLYPEDLMMAAFNTVTPTPAERSVYFRRLWNDWRGQDCSFMGGSHASLTAFAKGYGLKFLWDYQMSGIEIRFRTAEMKAFYILYMGEQG